MMSTFQNDQVSDSEWSPAWSQDSTKIASTDDSHGKIQVWDVATGNTLTGIQYQDPTQGLIGSTALAWSADGQYVAVAAGDITEWNLSTRSKVLTYHNQAFNPGNYELSLAWSRNGRIIASSSRGKLAQGQYRSGYQPPTLLLHSS